jgi:hypothetical protein
MFADAFTLCASDDQTQEKPTTPSGDALDDTGQDNQRKKKDNAAEQGPDRVDEAR